MVLNKFKISAIKEGFRDFLVTKTDHTLHESAELYWTICKAQTAIKDALIDGKIYIPRWMHVMSAYICN